MKAFFLGILILALFLGLGFVLQGVDLAQYNFWAPKYEAAHRNVYEETKSYQDGSRSDFEQYYVAYQTASDPASKQAILSVIRDRASLLSPQKKAEIIPPAVQQLIDSNQ
jgi:hypothetical protein